MGALLSIPLLTGGIGAIGSSLFSGCLLFMGERRFHSADVELSVFRWIGRFGVLQIMQLQLVDRDPSWLWGTLGPET